MIRSISLEKFRNFDSFAIDDVGPITIMIGPNGVGKTNILEAIAVAGGSDWHRYRRLGELVNWSAPYAAVELGFGDRNFETIRFVVKSNKAHYLIDKQTSRVTDIQARLAVMAFSPEMVTLFSGEPGIRRQFLNNILTPIYPEYAEALSHYQKVLKRRNAALKQQQRSQLGIWEEQLAESAAILLLSRQWALETISTTIEMQAKAYYKPSPRKVAPLLVPNSNLREMVEKNAGIVREYLREKWQGLREKELAVGFSLMGPQRDDWGMEAVFNESSFDLSATEDKEKEGGELNEELEMRNEEKQEAENPPIGEAGREQITESSQQSSGQEQTTKSKIDIGIYGSRGQERLTVIHSQLAALSILGKELDYRPIWLLDDVFGELDIEHQSHVVAACQKYQSFITTTNRGYEGIKELEQLSESKVISLGETS